MKTIKRVMGGQGLFRGMDLVLLTAFFVLMSQAVLAKTLAGPTVRLSVRHAFIAENGGSTDVRASLSAPSTEAVMVTLKKDGTATDQTDYTLQDTIIRIPAGRTSGVVRLKAVPDSIVCNII